MQLSDFHFDLPDELIARFPMAERSASRLLCLNGNQGEIHHSRFSELPSMLNEGDLLVFNNTRVIPARVYGRKASGGKLEVLIERITDEHRALAHLRSSKSPKPGSDIFLDDYTLPVRVTGRQGALFELELAQGECWLPLLERIGHMPLPPYIDRPDEASDQERYQTVYAQNPGAVAAPTAGLHFDDATLDKLRDKGVKFAYVTLHVGAGTFQPVRVDNILEHEMHSEWIDVPQETVDAILETRQAGGRVVAVGTTSVRSLESAAQQTLVKHGQLTAYQGDTDIFIYPGYQFQLIDAMVTNFHLPESTLIMLVSAFAGYDHTMQAYQQAVDNQYRFFSYGDAMFITRNTLI